MRNRVLHDALREFALESAALLSDEQRNAELKFDVVEERKRGGPTLYRYEPLTEQYIGDRWDRLRSLPTCPAAASALGAGATQYLSANGLRGGEAEPALRAMLERLYEDATSFAFPEERFESVYLEVERTLYQDTTRTVVAAQLRGVELEPERVELGDGLTLVREERFDGPSDWGEEPGALCLLERDIAPGGPSLLDEACIRFHLLELGLRLYKPGAVSLGALAWTRPGGGRWQPADLGYGGGAVRGEPWILVDGEEPELRDFLHAVARSTHGGPVAWALGRFEMGCSRELDAEALSDYLLALRALLDAGSETGQASLSLRLAALCAEEDERRMVQRRVELALALERFVMAGGDDRDYVDRIGSESPRLLVSEVERHLRALLRDVLCGYLETDLKGLADEILLRASGPGEETPPDRATEELEAIESAILRVRRLTPERDEAERAENARAETERAEVEEPPLPEAEPPLEEPDPEPVEEPESIEEPEPIDEPEPDELEPVGMLDGVTPSADWDDYSAPV
jgi:hypothetical protein